MYSEKFINDVIEAFPDSREIHLLARNSELILGRFMDEKCLYFPYQIVQKGFEGPEFNKTSYDAFVKEVKYQTEKYSLYEEWRDNYYLSQNYTPDFINKVKKVYKGNTEVINLTNSFSKELGRVLDESSNYAYKRINELLKDKKSTDEVKFNKIVDLATRAKRQYDVMHEWQTVERKYASIFHR